MSSTDGERTNANPRVCHVPTDPRHERAVLSILHAALDATERVLSDDHPDIDAALRIRSRHTSVADLAAHLVARRCAELRSLLDLYDDALDHIIELPDDMPF